MLLLHVPRGRVNEGGGEHCSLSRKAPMRDLVGYIGHWVTHVVHMIKIEQLIVIMCSTR